MQWIVSAVLLLVKYERIWKIQTFILPLAMAAAGNYHMGGYGWTGVYRVYGELQYLSTYKNRSFKSVWHERVESRKNTSCPCLFGDIMYYYELQE